MARCAWTRETTRSIPRDPECEHTRDIDVVVLLGTQINEAFNSITNGL